LTSAGLWTVSLDTLIALMAGFAIFPAVFAMGFEPGQGAGLSFVTLLAVFAKMPGGCSFL
jgi:NSS family neurotransmitter:Na+ symporter